MSYDDSRQAVPDLLDAIDEPTGLTIAEIIRAKHGYQPPQADLSVIDRNMQRQLDDPIEHTDRLRSILG